MSRAQCIVVREQSILMVECCSQGRHFWCLPGGGIEPGETPAEASVRELWEECCVRGEIIRETAVTTYGPGDYHYTFWVEIGTQEPDLGHDPEYAADAQEIISVRWRTLAQLSEKDRAFLWTAGLLTVPAFAAEVLSWSAQPSDPAIDASG